VYAVASLLDKTLQAQRGALRIAQPATQQTPEMRTKQETTR